MRASQPPDRWLGWLGLALALSAAALYVGLVVAQLGRPLLYDDANFAFAARAVAETGLPFGNQGWMSERGDFSQREQWALWHPPLYVYILGLAAKLGGPGEAILRIPGLLAGLASATLTFSLAGTLTAGNRAEKRLAGGVAAAMALVSPLFVQSTLVLDIDFAVLLPLTLLFLLAYLKLEGSPRAWLWLAPLFGLILWGKMTNPLPLLGAMLAWQVLRGQVWRALVHGAVIGVGGAALFAVTWAGVGTWLGFPLDMPFAVNLAQWEASADVARRAYVSPGAFLEGLQSTIMWLGPGLVAFGLVMVGIRAGQLTLRWEIRRVDLVLAVGLALVLGYVNKSAGWLPKYQVTLVPLLAAAGAPLLVLAVARPRQAVALAASTGAATALVAWVLVRDHWALQRVWVIPPIAGQWLLAILVVGMVLAAGWRVRAAPPVLLAGLALGWGVALSMVMARVPYSTTYWYGTSGTAEAAAWVDEHVAAGETYVAAKEVAFRARRTRYLDQETLQELLIRQRFDGTWAGAPIDSVVAWVREPYVESLLDRTLPSLGYSRTRQFGDYVVWQRAGAPGAPPIRRSR